MQPYFSWQYLGAFCSTGENLSGDLLDEFKAVGGKYVVVQLEHDGYGAEWNLAHVPELKELINSRGMSMGMWWDGRGNEDYAADAAQISGWRKKWNLRPVVLDCEGAYQWPQGDATLLSKLLKETRRLLPNDGTNPLGVSTNALNNAMCWNGRTGDTQAASDRSLYDLGIRALPQWYNSTNGKLDPWTYPGRSWDYYTGPNGNKENFNDPTAPGQRALPLAWIKATVEVTGLEGADMPAQLAEVAKLKARVPAYDFGLSIYLIENVTDPKDWAALAKYRGVLYKG